MNIKLSFQQDFYGIVYADYDRKINLLLNQKWRLFEFAIETDKICVL